MNRFTRWCVLGLLALAYTGCTNDAADEPDVLAPQLQVVEDPLDLTADCDLTIAGSACWLHDAYFEQGPGEGVAGSGVYQSFVRLGGGDVIQGVNTDGTFFHDEKAGVHTHDLPLNNVPVVEALNEFGVLTLYRIFGLDINQLDNKPGLSIDEIYLFLTTVPAIGDITAPNPDDCEFGQATGTTELVWSLDGDLNTADCLPAAQDDHWVLMNYGLDSGSGRADVILLVPDEAFGSALAAGLGGIDDCPYNGAYPSVENCGLFVNLWSSIGGATGGALVPWPLFPGQGNELEPITNNDGFEEWKVPTVPHILVDKTAVPDFKREHYWQLEKSVTPADCTVFGDVDCPEPFDYEIVATNVGSADTDFQVTGSIFIENPTESAGDVIITEVTDEIVGLPGDVEVICREDWVTPSAAIVFPYDLPVGATLECRYSLALDGPVPPGTPLTNLAAVSLDGLGGGRTAVEFFFGDTPTMERSCGYEGTFPGGVSNGECTEWGTTSASIVDDYATILTDDDLTFGPISPAQAIWEFSYSRQGTCIEAEGGGSAVWENMAGIEVLGLYDTETVTINCGDIEVTKTTAGSFTNTYDWTLAKDLDETIDLFIGQSQDGPWDVIWTRSDPDPSGFAVVGVITIENTGDVPAPIASVADLIDGVDAADFVECAAGGFTIPVGGSVDCDYSSAMQDSDPGHFNRAIVNIEGYDPFASPDEPIVFDGVTEVDAEATVVDTRTGLNQTVSGDGNYPTTETFACSADLGAYDVDGTYSWVPQENVATLTTSTTGTVLNADATKEINCFAPLLAKDAEGAYDERHEWTVEKEVTPLSQEGFPGDALDWVWTINVTETVFEENFAVAGNIYVTNPAGSPGSLTADLADELNDGTLATVDCDGSGATSVAVAPGATETCAYTATPTGSTADLNTATGTFPSIPYVATATDDFGFAVNVINASASLSDLEIGITDDIFTDSGTRTGDDGIVCSTDYRDYGPDGTYGETIVNIATLVEERGDVNEDDATTEWLCRASKVEVLKTTDGVVDPSRDFRFAVYDGPNGWDGTQVGVTSSTSGDADGLLEFGFPALDPDMAYTVCELNVPAGWSTTWEVNGGVVAPYNPNAANEPPEDLGVRCVDFGAGTAIPLVVGTPLRFEVDNSFPGGDPRTPGYWKNWNRCTNGGQQYNADDNGGADAGYWLLEDVLNGPGIVWDDMLVDDFLFEITECELAVMILDKRVEARNGRLVKKASNPLVNMATALLAAQLNFGAGACTTPEVSQWAMDAERLLDEYDYDGTEPTIGKKSPDARLANDLAGWLDDYNNGMYCGSLYTP